MKIIKHQTYILALVLSLVILNIAILPASSISTDRPVLTIEQPKPNAIVDEYLDVLVQWRDKLPNNRFAWMIVEVKDVDGYFPQNQIPTAPSHSFVNVPVFVGQSKPEDYGRKFNIIIVSLTKQGRRDFKNWKKHGEKSGDFRAIEKPIGTKEITRLPVIRRDPTKPQPLPPKAEIVIKKEPLWQTILIPIVIAIVGATVGAIAGAFATNLIKDRRQRKDKSA